MRRTRMAAVGLLVALGMFGVGIGPAVGITAPTSLNHTGVCAFTNYQLTGSFSLLAGNASFDLHATGNCVGTSTGVTVDLHFNSVGPWSCVGGVAIGGGLITANNGSNQPVTATLVNSGGEYVIELHLAGVAAGNITTLPIACQTGQTQTTIGGTGTLTFTA